MENHIGTTNLDNDKFVIKKGTRLVDLFEKMDVIRAVVRRENYRKQQGLSTVDEYYKRISNIPRDGFSGQRQSTASGSIPERGQ